MAVITAVAIFCDSAGVAVLLTAMLNVDAVDPAVPASPLKAARIECVAFAPPAIVCESLHPRLDAMKNITSIVMQYDCVPRMSLNSGNVSSVVSYP